MTVLHSIRETVGMARLSYSHVQGTMCVDQNESVGARWHPWLKNKASVPNDRPACITSYEYSTVLLIRRFDSVFSAL
jgi:hypothetical protein